MTSEHFTTVLDPGALRHIHYNLNKLLMAQDGLRGVGLGGGSGPDCPEEAGFIMEVFADAIQSYTNSILDRLEDLEAQQRKEVKA